MASKLAKVFVATLLLIGSFGSGDRETFPEHRPFVDLKTQSLSLRAIFEHHDIISIPQPGCRAKSLAGKARLTLVAPVASLLLLIGGGVYFWKTPSYPSHVRPTEHVEIDKIKPFLDSLTHITEKFIEGNSREISPGIKSQLTQFREALDKPFQLTQGGAVPVPVRVKFKKNTNGEWKAELIIDMLRMNDLLNGVATGDQGASITFGNTLVRAAQLMSHPRPEVMAEFVDKQLAKSLPPKTKQSLQALQNTIGHWGFTVMVGLGRTNALGYIYPTFSTNKSDSLNLEFGLDDKLFAEFIASQVDRSTNANAIMRSISFLLIKEGGGAAKILKDPQKVMDEHKRIMSTFTILGPYKTLQDQFEASKIPTILSMCKQITKDQVDAEAEGYRAALEAAQFDNVSFSAMAQTEQPGPTKNLLLRLGELQALWNRTSEARQEQELLQNIFLTETVLTMRDAAQTIIANGVGQGKLKLQNGKVQVLDPTFFEFLLPSQKVRQNDSSPLTPLHLQLAA